MKKRFLEVQIIYKPSYKSKEDETAFAKKLQNIKEFLLRENKVISV